MRLETKTTCPYCGTGCGIVASGSVQGGIAIRGDLDHPANAGRLCSKGAALGETLGLEGRLLQPRLNGAEVSWDTALDHVAGRFRKIIDQHGPDAVAFYVSGQLLTEDYYLANKLMKGCIGSANIDTNSRLCMSSSVAGHKRAFGADIVPGCYQDLELADLVVLTGSNLAWCHPVLFQRLSAAKKARPQMRVVVIDPRRTQTCSIADLHLPIRPGCDTQLFNGLLAWLAQQQAGDLAFVEAHTSGVAEALQQAVFHNPSPAAVADQCGLKLQELERFYRWFSETEQVVTVYSQGVNQSSAGTDKVNAVINCHLYTGRIGRPGMGPFSVTGQPNAMGGREVGGLANQLAAHMDLENPGHRQLVADFWGLSRVADHSGLKAVELFQAVEQGRVKALWVMGTNPAVSLPDSAQVRRALEQCECLVVSDCEQVTDTGGFAQVLLPALAWGEKSGTVTNSERCISRQRAFLDPPGEARADWWIINQVARRMGYQAWFDYQTPHQVFSEYARLTGYGNGGERLLDLSGLQDLDATGYDNLSPSQWPLSKRAEAGTARLFGEGSFATADRRARFVPVTPRPPASRCSDEYPLVLNSGRIRDQWHTMTRTGRAARLSSHIDEAYLEIHPDDARRYGLVEGRLARVTTVQGEATLRVVLSNDQQPGCLFAPMHWSDQFSSHGRIGGLIDPATDPLSGQPEFKHTPAAVSAYQPVWQGFLYCRTPLDIGGLDYWSRSRGEGVWRYELAGNAPVSDWPAMARSLLGSRAELDDWLEFADPARGQYRAALVAEGRLQGCLFVSSESIETGRDWLERLYLADLLSGPERMALLSGRAPAGQADHGKTVCACFQVGEKQILKAIREQGLVSLEAIGEAVQAGSGCGSCKPELALLLEQAVPLPRAAGS